MAARPRLLVACSRACCPAFPPDKTSTLFLHQITMWPETQGAAPAAALREGGGEGLWEPLGGRGERRAPRHNRLCPSPWEWPEERGTGRSTRAVRSVCKAGAARAASASKKSHAATEPGLSKRNASHVAPAVGGISAHGSVSKGGPMPRADAQATRGGAGSLGEPYLRAVSPSRCFPAGCSRANVAARAQLLPPPLLSSSREPQGEAGQGAGSAAGTHRLDSPLQSVAGSVPAAACLCSSAARGAGVRGTGARVRLGVSPLRANARGCGRVGSAPLPDL